MILPHCNLTEKQNKLTKSQNYISDIKMLIVPILNFVAISVKSLEASRGLQRINVAFNFLMTYIIENIYMMEEIE